MNKRFFYLLWLELMLFIGVPFLFSSDSTGPDDNKNTGRLNITTVDSSAYAVSDKVSFYFYLLDSEGNPVKEIDDEAMNVFEQDLFFDRPYKVEDFSITGTDRMVKPSNFLFLLDNSLSMYWYVLPGEFDALFFEKTILGDITLAAHKKHVSNSYYRQGDQYLLKKGLTAAYKNQTGYIINHYHENFIKTRMEVLQEVLHLFIASMPDSFDKKMVVSFHKEISLITDFTTSNEQVKTSLEDIRKPDEVKGWTELYEALNESAALLAEKGGRKFLILLSDGYQASDDVFPKESILEEALKTARENNIIIFTIGFGNDTDEKLLNELSGATGGISLEAQDKEYLERAYQKISAILENEFKMTCRVPNFFSTNRMVRFEYQNMSAEKYYKHSSILGAGVYPYIWFLLLLILFSIILLAGIRIFMHKDPERSPFINLDTDTRIIANTATLGLGSRKDANTSTKVAIKDGTCIIEGKKTRVNNNPVTGTRILKPGDVITADDGTKILFTGISKKK